MDYTCVKVFDSFPTDMNPWHSSIHEALSERVVVIGNSGSGKSTFAASLAALTKAPIIDLDILHWEDGKRGAKRDEESAKRMVIDAAAMPRWIIEGVYGWLAEPIMTRATALVWLDLPWDVCREGLLGRGQSRGATATDFAELLTWAEAYWDRQTPSSFAGHGRLFDAFAGCKVRLRDRQDIRDLLARLATSDVRRN
jgi:adenylate kinase family enzyme